MVTQWNTEEKSSATSKRSVCVPNADVSQMLASEAGGGNHLRQQSSTSGSPQHRPEFEVLANVARGGSAPVRSGMAGRPRAEGAPRPMFCEVWASPARSSAAKGPKSGWATGR